MGEWRHRCSYTGASIQASCGLLAAGLTFESYTFLTGLGAIGVSRTVGGKRMGDAALWATYAMPVGNTGGLRLPARLNQGQACELCRVWHHTHRPSGMPTAPAVSDLALASIPNLPSSAATSMPLFTSTKHSVKETAAREVEVSRYAPP